MLLGVVGVLMVVAVDEVGGVGLALSCELEGWRGLIWTVLHGGGDGGGGRRDDGHGGAYLGRGKGSAW